MKLRSCFFNFSVILVLVILYRTSEVSSQEPDDDVHDLLQSCCDKGRLRARASLVDENSCLHPVPELKTEHCKMVEQGCCKQYFRWKNYCDIGVNHALTTRQACDSLNNLNKNMSRICCNSCREGRLSNHSSDLDCVRPVSGHSKSEMLEGDAFMKCCQLDRCKPHNPCQHHCHDVTGARDVECSCKPGYQLMADGKSCILLAKKEPTNIPGPKDDKAERSSNGIILVIHSQSNEVPRCLSGHVTLWEGYSLFSKDMGSTGSCVRKFSTRPFQPFHSDSPFYMNIKRNLNNLWLTTDLPFRDSLIQGEEILKYISRCAVCEVPTNVITVHSQTENVPSCPSGWDELWEGYSFVAYTSGNGDISPGDSPAGPGSCLLKLREIPVIECGGKLYGCQYPAVRLSYWLAAIGNRDLRVMGSISIVSRCSVCSKK